MKHPAPLRCDLHGTVQELPVFFERLDAWADACQAPAGLSMRMGLMLDEWLTNVAMHAYGGQGGPVSVQVEYLPPHTLLSVVRDRGPAFDPTGMSDADVRLSMEEREIGGLGVHFVRRMAERFSYRRDGDWNELTLGYAATGKK